MTPERFQRLRAAVKPSYDKLRGHREQMALFQRNIAGPHFGDENTVDTRPVNMLELWHSQMLQNLSSADPQVLCLTHDENLKAAAREMELALNETLSRMHFADEHRLFVSGALTGVGIMMVGLETATRRMVDEDLLPMTNVFVEAIALEDFVLDMTANKWNTNQVTFCGHRYRMSLDDIRNNPDFDPEERERVWQQEQPAAERLRAISLGNGQIYDKFTDMGELWSLFVPEENEIVTFMTTEQGHGAGGVKPLRTVKWTGPRHGPYHWFGFKQIINNVLPLPPAANLFDADDLLNKLYTQCGLDASRQKTLFVTSVQGKKDGEVIRDAVSGSVIVSDNPAAGREVSLGGVNPNTLAMAENVKQMVSYIAGNLDSLAGLAQEGGTLGQEQIIKNSASMSVRAMQVAVSNATEAILQDVAFYLHHHPQPQRSLTLSINGGRTKLPITWPMQQDENGVEFDSRQGEFDQYAIKLVPYSTVYMTPGERAQQLERIYMQIIMPIVASGAPPPEGLDVLLSYLAKYMGMPEIEEMYPASQQYDNEQRGGGDNGMRKPPMSTRNYVRTSVAGGMTPQAASQQAQMALLGGGGNNNQQPGAA
jgi:hypothetical protein